MKKPIRSCRTDGGVYRSRSTAGNTRRRGPGHGRLEKLTEPRPVPHVFSHPKSESYDTLHKRFRAQNPWFKYTRLNGETHFPGVELPREVAADIEGFLQTK
ncbi:hypothetical protein GA0115254_12835 [Streptomyces sp. Ncost-T10-10d]|nr:hypothetical protein GA0115254_12835 [Streptomyces sp. Ncost-T10-10d]